MEISIISIQLIHQIMNNATTPYTLIELESMYAEFNYQFFDILIEISTF